MLILKRKRSGLETAAKKIVLLVEKGLAKVTAKERDARLERIHQMASNRG